MRNESRGEKTWRLYLPGRGAAAANNGQVWCQVDFDIVVVRKYSIDRIDGMP
jgi:hypothetical protein